MKKVGELRLGLSRVEKKAPDGQSGDGREKSVSNKIHFQRHRAWSSSVSRTQSGLYSHPPIQDAQNNETMSSPFQWLKDTSFPTSFFKTGLPYIALAVLELNL